MSSKLHRVWIVEYPVECLHEFKSSMEAREFYDSITLNDGETKYLYITHDDDDGNFYPEFDVGLKYESKEER